MSDPNLNLVRTYLTDLQECICSRLENYESSKCFIIDDWDRNNGSSNSAGSSRILEDGQIFEKMVLIFLKFKAIVSPNQLRPCDQN